MQTKEINKITIKPVVHLALESHEILVIDLVIRKKDAKLEPEPDVIRRTP